MQARSAGAKSSRADAPCRIQAAFEQTVYDDQVVNAGKFIVLKLSTATHFLRLRYSVGLSAWPCDCNCSLGRPGYLCLPLGAVI